MQFRDAELLNNSLDRLGDTLLRQRVLQQQQDENDANRTERQREFDTTGAEHKREFDAGQDIQKQHLDISKGRADAELAHWSKLEETAKVGNSLKQLATHGTALKTAFGVLGDQVRAGAITNDDANRYVQDYLNALPDEMRAPMTSNPQFKPILEGTLDWTKMAPPKPVNGPSDVEKDRAAAALESQAAGESDPATKQIYLDRAKSLRSGIGRVDPTSYAEENEILERDPNTGAVVKSRKRKVPIGTAPAGPTQAVDPSKIPPAAAAYLKKNPASRDEFDSKYGKGAAALILAK